MKSLFLIAFFGLVVLGLRAQPSLYFPPLSGATWATTSTEALNWNETEIPALYEYLQRQNTKAFLVLKDGKIVLEKYFDQFTQDSIWYWASAGKTITALLTGIAQEQNQLKLEDPTSKYLGTGWTTAPAEKEALISVWHQLTMTSGLNDGVADIYCTEPNCLKYLTDAGTRWAYHNAPYTLLEEVIEKATGMDYNLYTRFQLGNKIGMRGIWFKSGYNNVYASTPRDMARFGLLILNKGNWNGTSVLKDTAYFRQMVNTSQNINPSYGYLWWLNGKSSYLIPRSQFKFNGALAPNAPEDMFAAMGKNGQLLNIIPSQGLVVVRMGDNPDESLVPFLFQDEMWVYLSKVIDSDATAITDLPISESALKVFPNPVRERLFIRWTPTAQSDFWVTIYNSNGQQVLSIQNETVLNATSLQRGLYSIVIQNEAERALAQFVKL